MRPSSRPLRVEVVAGAGGLGGAERFVLELLDRAADRVAVTVASLGASGLVAPARARAWPVDELRGGPGPVDVARGALTLARRWRRARPDVVLANGVRAAASAVPAGALGGTPVVWAKHDFSYDGWTSRALGRIANGVIATSAAVAASTRRADAVVLAPPRPAEPLPREEAAARLVDLGVDADRGLVAAAIGRLVPYKGFDDAVVALASPAAAGWQLVVIGSDDPADPGEATRLARIAADHGVEDRVAVVGDVPDAGRLLSAFDAVLVPTKSDDRGHGREGYGIVADEAMVARVPVVTATGGATTDRVGAAGLAVAPGRPDQLAEALGALLDPERRTTLGTEGRRRADELLDATTTSQIFVSVLAAAAGRPGAGLVAGPPVSVVVPVHNEADGLVPLLDRLRALVGSDDELLVVEGGSSDGTAELLRAEPSSGYRVVDVPPGCGPAAARNAGIAAARHDVVACTDAGCEPDPGWLEALRAGFAERPAPVLVTGVYRVRARGIVEAAAEVSCYPDIDEARAASLFARLYGRVLGRRFEARLPTGRSVAFTRPAWDAVGGFPEDLRTGEDVTFGSAIARTGGRVLLSADAAVTWDQRPTLRDAATMYYRYGIGDGESRDARLVGRNVVRLAAYGLAPVLVVFGSTIGLVVVAIGAAAYVSLPFARIARRRLSPLVALFVPVALAVKDVAKALGCLRGLLRSPRRATRGAAGPVDR